MSFEGQMALRGAGIEVRPGEIHALMGPNGSGKSTLIKVLSGALTPEPGGMLEIDGARVGLPTRPSEVHEHSVRFVHQDLALIAELTVLENLFLGAASWPRRARTVVDWRRARELAGRAIRRAGLGDMSLDLPAGGLTASQQSLLALARAMVDLPGTGGYAILDEPTASMNGEQVDSFFDVLRELSGEHGMGIVLVSHRLAEVFRIADRITVLREGAVAMSGRKRTEIGREELLVTLIGSQAKELLQAQTRRPSVAAPPAESRLEFTNLRSDWLNGVSGAVGRGEILGITGLEGCGKEDLVHILTGQATPTGGTVSIDGQVVHLRSVRDALASGIGYVPADRRSEGGIGDLSIQDNIMMPRPSEYWSKGRFRRGSERHHVHEVAARHGITPNRPESTFATMSGGNQQKVVLAKWLSAGARILVLHEPTSAVDVGARASVYRLLRAAADDSISVIFVTSDFDEIPLACDRVLVLADGRIAADLDASTVSSEDLTRASYGAHTTEA